MRRRFENAPPHQLFIGEMMELRQLKRGDKFKVVGVEDCPVIIFLHLDGMYSYNTIDLNDSPIHLRFDTPVEKINDK